MKFLFGTFSVLLFAVTVFAGSVPALAEPADTTSILTFLKQSENKRLVNPELSRKLAEKALIASKQLNYSYGTGKSFYNIGMTYWAQSYVPESQFYLILALPYLKNRNADLALCYATLGRNYAELGSFDESSRYFQKALKLAGNDIRHRGDICNDMVSLYLQTKKYDAALRCVDTALSYSRALKSAAQTAILYSRLSQIYLGQGKIDLAQRIIDTCYAMCTKIENKRLLSIVLVDKAKLSALKGDYKTALNLGWAGYHLADELGMINIKLRGLKNIAEVYERQHNLDSAYKIQQMRLVLRNNLEVTNNRRALQVVQDYFAMSTRLNSIEQDHRKNEDNLSQIKAQHRTIALLVVLLITAIAVLAIIYFYYKQKHALSNKLQQQHQTLINQKEFIELQRTDLEAVNRVKDKLLAIIGHDLRMPIANLGSIAELFGDGYISEEEVRKLMTDIIPVIKGAELTLANLTGFAGSQIKGRQLNLARLDIHQAANEVGEIFRHQLKQKNLTYLNNCQPDLFATADENHIKVVLNNLVSNAIKFTNNKGQITVSSRREEGKVVVCVCDTGVGMTLEQANKLFSYSEHLSEQGTMGEKGTGIGLLLCKELITMNNGNLWLETQPQAGCKLCFTLPVAD